VSQTSTNGELVTTVNADALCTIRWGLMRQLFPDFVAEIELGRFVRKLLAGDRCAAVRN
jgi:hypothetical protein